jgi:teichuronic acid biosynthesis glycosyltransferase TuaG
MIDNNNNPLVSIITPCYNADKFIAETIESVLSQTYQNWEMLICDDCSTDNSVEIIRAYADKDSRIKLFKTPHNTGTPAEPRNIAIDNAKGYCVAFLDADDVWLPNKLETEVGFMLNGNYEMVYSNYEKISWEGKRSGRVVIAPKTATYNDMVKSCVVPACITTMIKRELVGDIRFKTMPKEDYAFWLKVFRQGFTAYNTNTLQGLYRQTQNSRSSNKFKLISAQWNVLRDEEGLNFFYALYCLSVFLVKGYIKYLK